MPRDLEPSLNTKNFTLSALQNGLRLDSRKLTEPSLVPLSFGENPGSAYVELGKTKYISNSLSAGFISPHCRLIKLPRSQVSSTSLIPSAIPPAKILPRITY